MSDAGRIRNPGAAPDGRGAAEAEKPYLPRSAADWTPASRYARIGAERQAAVAQIQRSLKVWRAAAKPTTTAAKIPEGGGAPQMLHNNASADFKPFVGNEFDEGTTEYLTIQAMIAAKLKPTHSYPQQEACVQKLLSAGFSVDSLKTAYFKGGTKALPGDWVDSHCKGKWIDVKTAMQAKDFAKAQKHLDKK
jgi:hypothetical protein